jgi:hypothetical protein
MFLNIERRIPIAYSGGSAFSTDADLAVARRLLHGLKPVLRELASDWYPATYERCKLWSLEMGTPSSRQRSLAERGPTRRGLGGGAAGA